MISKKEEVLRQLKLVRKAKKISYQDIVEGTENLGTPVSLASVKRVFSENSNVCDFKYDYTIRPIVRFVMGIDGDVEELESLEAAKANVEGLAAVVDFKDSYIARLEADLDRTRVEHKETVEKMEAAETRKINYLKEEIKDLKAEKAMYEAKIIRWRTTSILFLSLFVTALLLVIAYLLTDHENPNWGIFWAPNSAPLQLLAIMFGGAVAIGLFAATRKK